jgi:hypothetical protein
MKLKSGTAASNSFTASDFPLLGSDRTNKKKAEISQDGREIVQRTNITKHSSTYADFVVFFFFPFGIGAPLVNPSGVPALGISGNPFTFSTTLCTRVGEAASRAASFPVGR